MANCKLGEYQVGSVSETPVRERKGGRKRSPTLLKLQWLAERVRKCERIKREVAEGKYEADSREIARALLSMQAHSENE